MPCPVQGLQMEPYWLINRSAKRFIYLCCHIRDLFYSAFVFVNLIGVRPLLGPVSVDLEDIFFVYILIVDMYTVVKARGCLLSHEPDRQNQEVWLQSYNIYGGQERPGDCGEDTITYQY